MYRLLDQSTTVAQACCRWGSLVQIVNFLREQDATLKAFCGLCGMREVSSVIWVPHYERKSKG